MWLRSEYVEDLNDICCEACALRIPEQSNISKVCVARRRLESSEFSERWDAVDILGNYGDAQDIDRLINAQSDIGDNFNPPEVMLWKAGQSLEMIAKRLGSSGTPLDVQSLIKLILLRVELSIEAAVESLVTLLTKYATEIDTINLEVIAHFDDKLSQLRSYPVRELDYEGNEKVWEPVDCVALKALAKQELARRRSAD